MQIVIPLSGEGRRFLNAGYLDPKPLIKVHGKSIIEYVVDLFPGEEDFVFICRDEHVEKYQIDELLLKLKPQAKVKVMKGEKLGPVYSVFQAFDHIKDSEPVIVSYCDYFMDWDYEDFKKVVAESGCAGAIPAYSGFHPHLLPEKNFYASMRVDEQGYMEEIREKHSFTPDKGDSPQSPGMYYFKSGELLKKYFKEMLERGEVLGGEYYVSLVYPLLKERDEKILVYDKVPFFCQWGTPEDFAEYNFWLENISESESHDSLLNKARAKFPQYSEEIISQIIDYWKGFIKKTNLNFKKYD
jgi:NDP-sugar pyrophosphorylase family protein